MGDNCDCEEECTCGCEDDCCCDDECCCGDDSGLDISYLVVGTVGFLMLGLMMLFVSVSYLNPVMNLGIDTAGFTEAKLILSLIVVLIGAYGLKEGLVSESIVLMLIGISAFVFAFTALYFGGSGFMFLDVVIGIGLLVPTVVFLMRREILAFVATVLVAVGLLVYGFLTGDSSNYMLGIPMLISSIIFIYVAFGNTIFAEIGDDLLPLI